MQSTSVLVSKVNLIQSVNPLKQLFFHVSSVKTLKNHGRFSIPVYGPKKQGAGVVKDPVVLSNSHHA